MARIFEDRRDAGRALARAISGLVLDRPIVLALPRGGVPVAAEIADALQAPLDILVVRKLGAPWQPELAIGAIASGGIRVLNHALIEQIPGLDENAIEAIAAKETDELLRRERAYRGDRPYPGLAGRDVLLVDDGMATGATMRAAVEAVRSRSPARIIVAVPTGSRDAVVDVGRLADEVICLESPAFFYAVGQFYRDFGQTTDEEVRDCLERVGANQEV